MQSSNFCESIFILYMVDHLENHELQKIKKPPVSSKKKKRKESHLFLPCCVPVVDSCDMLYGVVSCCCCPLHPHPHTSSFLLHRVLKLTHTLHSHAHVPNQLSYSQGCVGRDQLQMFLELIFNFFISTFLTSLIRTGIDKIQHKLSQRCVDL